MHRVEIADTPVLIAYTYSAFRLQMPRRDKRQRRDGFYLLAADFQHTFRQYRSAYRFLLLQDAMT